MPRISVKQKIINQIIENAAFDLLFEDGNYAFSLVSFSDMHIKWFFKDEYRYWNTMDDVNEDFQTIEEVFKMYQNLYSGD